jgi:hypothetical protein
MPFTAKLLALSPWIVLFLINLTFIGFALILLFLVKRYWGFEVRKNHNDITSAIFNRTGAIYGMMLSFVVVVLWQQYNITNDNALKEGKLALELYRDLRLYPDKKQAELTLNALINFARLVVMDEYPAMTQMKESDITQQAMNNLWDNIQKMQPNNPIEKAIYNKILKEIENISTLRDKRLLDVESSLPSVLWSVIIIGSIISIWFTAFLGAENYWMHAIAISMLAIIIATTIFLIIQLDYPFIG